MVVHHNKIQSLYNVNKEIPLLNELDNSQVKMRYFNGMLKLMDLLTIVQTITSSTPLHKLKSSRINLFTHFFKIVN